MEVALRAICILHLENDGHSQTCLHRGVKLGLDVSSELNLDTYIDDEGLPTEDGTKALTNVLVQGLIANIHRAQYKGHWKDHEHIKFIMDELQRGFIEIAEHRSGAVHREEIDILFKKR